MDIPTDLLADFCRVTNADEALATQLLRDSGLDLQEAIHSFLAIQEAGGIPETENAPRDPTPEIPSPSDHDNDFEYPRPQPVRQESPSAAPRAFTPSTTTRRQPAPYSGPPHRRPGDAIIQDPFLDDIEGGDARAESLAALFRPPTHLVHSGSFEEAMSAGRAQQRWVLVNVQRSDVFASHVMNRDVWSDAAMQQLIQAHFVFWQRDERLALEYTRFYSFSHAPHVAVVDPRSGERVRLWGDHGDAISKVQLMDALQDFVSGNSLDSDRVIRGRTGQAAASSSARGTTLPPSASMSTMDVDAEVSRDELPIPVDHDSEDAQLAAAIAASMEGAPETANGETNNVASAQRAASRLLSATDPSLNRSRSLRAEQDDAYQESLALDRAKAESERNEQLRQQREQEDADRRERERADMREAKRRRVPQEPPKNAPAKVTELAIRLPNGKRLQRRFLASDNIGCVYDFIETEEEQLDGVPFELMLAFPKKSYADREILLEELAPKAALVVHLID